MKRIKFLPTQLSPYEQELEKALNRPREFRGRKCYPDTDIQMIHDTWQLLYNQGKKFTQEDMKIWCGTSVTTISRHLSAEQKKLMRELPK